MKDFVWRVLAWSDVSSSQNIWPVVCNNRVFQVIVKGGEEGGGGGEVKGGLVVFIRIFSCSFTFLS